jgi:hypothetical protein
MAIYLYQQPASNTLVAAYRPIVFSFLGSQQPNNSDACPVIMVDVYINGKYSSSISVTDYEKYSFFGGFIFTYAVDIQDKIQEVLNSNFARLYENTSGDMENSTNETFSCSVQVMFREGYVDASGFTQFYGTAPIQGTKFTLPIAGIGTATSNVFYALNATLQHEDNQNLGLHLDTVKDPFQTTYALSHRPNFMTYINKTIGGGKYFICSNDNDYIFCFSNNNTPSPWYMQVIGKYKNGTTFNTWPQIVNYPTTTTPSAGYKVYSFNAGIPNLRNVFGGVKWNDVVEYEVFVFALFFQAMRQYYYVNQCGCCDDHTRIFFLNNLGTYDGINFEYKQEISKTESTQYQSSLPAVMSGKSATGLNRYQPKQNEFCEVQCKCYGEADMNFIKELLGTPRAYLQWEGTQGQSKSLLPILIEDSEIVTLKNKDAYEYIITIKYRMSNERINLRN